MSKNKNLGKRATDKMTGFSGYTTGFCQYITGCDQYLIRPKCDKNEKYPDAVWLDAHRLDFDDKDRIVLELPKSPKKRGADIPAPIK